MSQDNIIFCILYVSMGMPMPIPQALCNLAKSASLLSIGIIIMIVCLYELQVTAYAADHSGLEVWSLGGLNWSVKAWTGPWV